nr:ribonuclease H2 subunit B [Tanacetum cinerariifolium]
TGLQEMAMAAFDSQYIVSIAGTTSTEQPPLKDKSMCNKTAKNLWDALARHMLGSEYGEQDRKAAVLYESVAIPKIINQGDVNDTMGSKKKTVVVTSDPLALIAETTNVQQLKQNLLNLDKNYAAQNQKDTLADAVMILGEYLADEPWLKLLCNNIRLSMDEAVQAPDTDIQVSDAPSIHSSFNPVQEQTTGDKRVTRNGKQNKKARVEMNSRSIKDTFTKASRRGR